MMNGKFQIVGIGLSIVMLYSGAMAAYYDQPFTPTDSTIYLYHFDNSWDEASGHNNAWASSTEQGSLTMVPSLSGFGQAVEFADGGSITNWDKVSTSSVMQFDFWMSAGDFATDGDYVYLAQDNSFVFLIERADGQANDGKLRIYLGDGSSYYTEFFNNPLRSTTTFAADEWHHVTLQVTGTELNLVIDGEVESTREYSSGVSGNGQFMTLGAWRANQSGLPSGKIDELMISTELIPEPATMMLLGLGSVLGLIRKKK